MTTDSGVSQSSYDGYTYCTAGTELYIGAFYRNPATHRARDTQRHGTCHAQQRHRQHDTVLADLLDLGRQWRYGGQRISARGISSRHLRERRHPESRLGAAQSLGGELLDLLVTPTRSFPP